MSDLSTAITVHQTVQVVFKSVSAETCSSAKGAPFLGVMGRFRLSLFLRRSSSPIRSAGPSTSSYVESVRLSGRFKIFGFVCSPVRALYRTTFVSGVRLVFWNAIRPDQKSWIYLFSSSKLDTPRKMQYCATPTISIPVLLRITYFASLLNSTF